jgi:hypothetical protein
MKILSTAAVLGAACVLISNGALAQVWIDPPNESRYAVQDLRPRCFGPGPVIWPDRRGENFGPWREDIFIDAPIDGGDWPRPVPCTHRTRDPLGAKW